MMAQPRSYATGHAGSQREQRNKYGVPRVSRATLVAKCALTPKRPSDPKATAVPETKVSSEISMVSPDYQISMVSPDYRRLFCPVIDVVSYKPRRGSDHMPTAGSPARV
jgi:hypothetical protein